MFKKWREKRKRKKLEKLLKKDDQAREFFDKRIVDLKIKTLQEALQSVLVTEVKRTDETTGKEVLDLRTTASLMKTKARVALDFVSNLDKGENVEK